MGRGVFQASIEREVEGHIQKNNGIGMSVATVWWLATGVIFKDGAELAP
jgi:hypothetical protein